MHFNVQARQGHVLLTFIFTLLFCLCANAANESNDATGTTSGEHFRVTYKSDVAPLPLNQIHRWTLHVETLDGKPVENAAVTVNGGMPAHRHGLPTRPQASEIGHGDYIVEGLKFSMTGLWEMWFEIETDQATDKVKFIVNF